jgi:hypothetical protein
MHTFSSASGTFSKIDHILGQKALFNKYKTIERISCILSDLIKMKLEVNTKKNYKNFPNT